MYGFDPKEGMSAWDKRLERIHPDDCDWRQQAIDRAINEKSDYEVEYRILLPGGAVRYLRSVGHPVLNASGDLVQFVGSSTDITERKQAEEALRRAQADLAHINRVSMMGELAASLAHELKQPIAAALTDAKTCVRWLRRDTPDVAEGCEAALRMINDATRAAEVIDRVRSLYRRDTSDRELLDVNEIIREMIILLHDKADRNSISIRTELDSGLPLITADRVQLQQVLMNLLLNGIEAMKDANGELTVTSKRTNDGQLLVSVSDSGIGLPGRRSRPHFRGFLHHQSAGHRHGTVHQSEDYRVSRRLFVGVCQCATRRDISVHTAHRRGGVLTIGRVTLGSTQCFVRCFVRWPQIVEYEHSAITMKRHAATPGTGRL